MHVKVQSYRWITQANRHVQAPYCIRRWLCESLINVCWGDTPLTFASQKDIAVRANNHSKVFWHIEDDTLHKAPAWCQAGAFKHRPCFKVFGRSFASIGGSWKQWLARHETAWGACNWCFAQIEGLPRRPCPASNYPCVWLSANIAGSGVWCVRFLRGISGPSMCTVCRYGLQRLGGFLWGKMGIRSSVKRGAVKWKNTGAATIIFWWS